MTGVDANMNEIDTVVAGVAGQDKYVSQNFNSLPKSKGWVEHSGSIIIPDNFQGNTLRVDFSSVTTQYPGSGNILDYVRFSTAAEPILQM